ncbi:MAG TPA: cache domain-containing protein [Marmoricola sp.]|nr:cache domain-containing protein [Marmoricola sp.]
MSTQTTIDLSPVIDAVVTLAGEAFTVADEVAASVRAQINDEIPTSRDAFASVELVARRAIASPGSRIQGAGFVSAVGLLPDDQWWLEWFVRESDDRAGRLEVSTDPTAMGFHDYERQPWYRVPQATGQPHVTGPYVDNMCSQDYTLTFTKPMTVRNRFVGVAGADIDVRSAEQVLLPVLRAVPAAVGVVNADGRTLVSNRGDLVCGELLPAPINQYNSKPLPGLPLRVILL